MSFISILQNITYNNGSVYPHTTLHRAMHYKTMFDTTILPYNKHYNNCKNTLCYTQSKGTSIYKSHTGYGMVGTTSASYLGRRNRL